MISGCTSTNRNIEDSCFSRTYTETEETNEDFTIIGGHFYNLNFLIDTEGREKNLVFGRVRFFPPKDPTFKIDFFVFDQKNFNSWKSGQVYNSYFFNSIDNYDEETNMTFRFIPDKRDFYYFVISADEIWNPVTKDYFGENIYAELNITRSYQKAIDCL